MTRNDFMKNVAQNNITEEVIAYAQTEYAKVAEDEERKNAENATLVAAITEYLSAQTELKRASEIAEAVDCTTSKASNLCKKMAENGTLVRESVVFDKRSVYAYKIS